MKIIYDQETDVLTVIFKDSSIKESDELKEGVIADYDEHGDIVSLEILDASLRVSEPLGVDLKVEGVAR